MTQRQEGYYWVKSNGNTRYNINHWNGDYWDIHDYAMFDDDFVEIDEHRIPTPDEVKNE